MDYSIQKDTYFGIPKCYKAQSVENMDDAGILPILNDRTLSLTGQGVRVLIVDETGEHLRLMEEIVRQSAPEAEIDAVGIEDADDELKSFYFVPREERVIPETEIMEALALYDDYENPLVICLPFGCNNGSHSGDSLLSSKINQMALRPKNAVVVAAGNEAVNGHHYVGRANSFSSPQRVEILVPEDMDGFYFELWTLPPERCEITIQSPTGEVSRKGSGLALENITYNYLFEKTTVSIDYRDVGITSRGQLIFVRFTRPIAGIWTINVFPKFIAGGIFHIWLPMKGLLAEDVVFLEPDPSNTITMPADAKSVISVGGYDVNSQTIFLESGRGYTIDGAVKPDFIAPCRENRFLGTSVASAVISGACALVLEWALGRGDADAINTIDIKNFLIRGCERREDTMYPNPIEGYGKMNLFNSFLLLK